MTSDAELIAASFRYFATHQRSNFERRVYATVAQNLEIASEHVDFPGWSEKDPIAHALPLRLLAGLHGLVRSGRAPYLAEVFPPHDPSPEQLWLAIVRAMGTEGDYIAGYLRLPVLNNELGRSAAVLGACLLVSRQSGELPFTLLELGASAGLNLLFDRYFFDLGHAGWGGLKLPRENHGHLGQWTRGPVGGGCRSERL